MRMHRFSLAAALLLAPLASRGRAETPSAPPTAQAADEALRRFLDDEWQRHLRANPIEATFVGDHRYDGDFEDASAAGVTARQQARRASRAQLTKLLEAPLSPTARLNGELYAWWLDRDLAADRFCEECMPVSSLGGPFEVLFDLVEVAPPTTVVAAEALLQRMDKFPDYLAAHRAFMERGLKEGIVPPRLLVEKLPARIRKQVPRTVEESPLYKAFEKLDASPAGAGGKERPRLQARARQLLATRVFPALSGFADFLERQYAPRCRDTVGLSALPNGKEWYRQRVARFTTLQLEPDAIHQLGLDEVARLTAEMEKVRQQAGFAGPLPQYLEHLRTDPKHFYTQRDDLLRGYRDIAKRIDGELPRLFGKLPRMPYGVVAVPSYQEETTTTAYYFPGSSSDGRAGRFYANTFNLSARPRWEMEALTLHEAVPGHHLQISLAQELGDVPEFRKHLYIEAFGEGWGLYAESLGDELGLYRTPELKMGQLIYEMWRAVRLVVDTGLHSKGWTRQQALAYFERNTGKSKHDIAVEVDRYIAWPGQALAYKIGQRKILELRRRAETALGARFDRRRFHDTILEAGSLPLPMIEARVQALLAEETTKRNP